MKPSSRPRRAQSPARRRLSASRWLGPGSEVRNAAAAPHLRVVAAAPDAACQGQPAARPRPARPPSPGRPHFRPSGQSQSPGHEGDASRSAAPSRTEVGPQSPSALFRTRWLCSPAKPRQAGPRPARGPFPWQQSELRRPTAAKPRCVTSQGHRGSGRSLPSAPLTLQHAHSSFPPITFHKENPLSSTSNPQFVFQESYSPQNASSILFLL